jgi:hypothetical protein
MLMQAGTFSRWWQAARSRSGSSVFSLPPPPLARYRIARDFTRRPGPRYRDRGAFSGEEFRETVLIPIVERGEPVEIDLDGTCWYGSSFLEEAFGGLIRQTKISVAEFRRLFHLISDEDTSYILEIMEYVTDADDALRRQGLL